MASFSKPTAVPRWADTNVLIIEPPEAKKDAGWLFQEVPPSNFENWRTQLNGDWWKWVDERLADGATADALAIVDPSGANADPIVEISGLTPLESDFIFEDSGVFSKLNVVKDAQALHWMTDPGGGFVEVFEASPGKLRVGPSDTDGIRMFGTGALKGITFDTNFNQLRYDINTDTFHFFCDSASTSFNIKKDRIQAFQSFIVGAGAPQDVGDLVVQNGVAVGSGNNPGAGQGIFGNQITVGTGTIPAGTYSQFSNGGLQVGTPDDSPATLGAGGFIAQEIRCMAGDFGLVRTVSEEERQIQFADTGGDGSDNMLEFDTIDLEFRLFTNQNLALTIDNSEAAFNGRLVTPKIRVTSADDYVVDRFEQTKRNAIGLTCRTSSLGTVSGRVWNMNSVIRIGGIGSGNWRVQADQTLGDDSIAVVCPASTNHLFPGASAFYDDTNNWVEVQTSTYIGGGSTGDVGFALIAVGT